MAKVKEFSGVANASGTTCTVTVPAGGVAAGHYLVLGVVVALTAGLPTVTVADSRGNTWVKDQEAAASASSSGHQFHCKPATALQAGDTITITLGAAQNRIAGVVVEFDDDISAVDVGTASNNGGANTSSPSSGATATTTQASELVVGVQAVTSQGRVYTPQAAYSVTAKVATTAGSGDRAVYVQWKYVAATGAQTSNGTFDTSSICVSTVETYKIAAGGGGGGGAGSLKRWNGSAFKTGGTLKRWNGSAFKTGGTLRRWDGSSFHPAP